MTDHDATRAPAMPHLPTPALLAGTLAALIAASRSAMAATFPVLPPNPIPAVTWGACPAAWTDVADGELGNRLQCTSMSVPLDHLAPDGRRIDVGVMRVRAAVPFLREGAIFFNNGGPGWHPGKFLTAMAAAWTGRGPDDPGGTEKRRLAERYDLVAVIPRGLSGSGEVHCVTGLPPPYDFLPTNLGAANWRLAMEYGRAVAAACAAPAHARHVNTEQHVHDMEMVRRILGDEHIHFYGISYGGVVGAWYAAFYPGRVGRLLLDSSMDFTGDYRAALRMRLQAREKEFVEDVVNPLLKDPARYGLGPDAGAVALAIAGLPAYLRKHWADRLASTPQLAAALHIAELLRQYHLPTLADLTRLLRQPLADDGDIDRRLHVEADRLAPTVYASPRTTPSFDMGPDGDSTRVILSCNDWRWTRTEREIRETLRQDADRFHTVTGVEARHELACLHWGPPAARPPALDHVEHVPAFLLIQSDKDTATPLPGARRIFNRFANAHMLLVLDSKQHGVFNFSNSTCIERTAARYLLTGQLPVTWSHMFTCEGTGGSPVDAMPGSPPSRMDEPRPALPPPPSRHDEL